MEEAERRKDSKKLFSIINKLAGKRGGKVIGMQPVKNLQGEVLSEKHDVLNRWKEHFENLLNCDAPADKERTIAEIRAAGDNINENSNYGYQQTSSERHEGHSGRHIEGHKSTKER